jgi:hypothetical protein
LLTCSHTVQSLQLQYQTVPTHGPERVDSASQHIHRLTLLERPRCRLLHCLTAAASLWSSKVVDPRQSSQGFSSTGLESLPGGVWNIWCLSGPLTTPPTPLASLHRRFTPPRRTHRRTLSGHLADRGVNDADPLQTLSSGAWDKAVGSARTVAPWWVPPPTVGAIAGGWRVSTAGF